MASDPELEPFELPPGLAEDAALARRAGPTKAQRLRLRTKLGPPPGGPPGGAPAPPTAAPARATLPKLAAAAALLVAIGGGLVARLGPAGQAALAHGEREQRPAEREQRPAEREQRPAEPPAPGEPLGHADLEAAGESAREHTKELAPPETTPRDVAGSERPAPRAARELPSELGLLEAARRALAARPAEALRACERHQHLYPEGFLEEEREALAIEALVRSGRRTRAVRRFDAFVARFAQSPHRAHLAQVLAPTAPAAEERAEN
jgi:hypothetical protein